MIVSDELISDALNYLNITWADEDQGIKTKVSGILQRGMQYLNDIAGKDLDFQESATHTGLLLDYARYAMADSLEDFQKNYLHELLALRIRTEGERYVYEQENAEFWGS